VVGGGNFKNIFQNIIRFELWYKYTLPMEDSGWPPLRMVAMAFFLQNTTFVLIFIFYVNYLMCEEIYKIPTKMYLINLTDLKYIIK
jgi:hypothetical protein